MVTEEAKMERVIAEVIEAAGMALELRARPKSDAKQMALAERLRAQTTMTVGWIAERLGMGSRGCQNHLLYRRRKFRGK